jgi:hypothetical protein
MSGVGGAGLEGRSASSQFFDETDNLATKLRALDSYKRFGKSEPIRRCHETIDVSS